MKGRLAVAVLVGGLALTAGCGSQHHEDPCAVIAHIQNAQERVDAGVQYANGDLRIDERCLTFETPQQVRDDIAVTSKDPAKYAGFPEQLAQ
jgi:hypothetical protein